MQRPKWLVPGKLVLNKKVLFPVLGIVVLLSILAVTGKFIAMSPKLASEDLWAAALEKTRAGSTYRYQVEVSFNGKTNFRGEGERVSPDKVHLKGTMGGVKLELVQIGDKGYMKDPFSGQWLSLEGNQLSDSELFITELNPLGMFNFKGIPEIRDLGKEKIGDEECFVLKLRPNVANPFMENFINFEYKVWISPGDYLIKQADIKALAKGHNPVKFNLKLKFKDFNQNISIKPPKVG